MIKSPSIRGATVFDKILRKPNSGLNISAAPQTSAFHKHSIDFAPTLGDAEIPIVLQLGKISAGYDNWS